MTPLQLKKSRTPSYDMGNYHVQYTRILKEGTTDYENVVPTNLHECAEEKLR